MKPILVVTISLGLLFHFHSARAGDCTGMNLKAEVVKAEPSSNLKRTYFKNSKYWFTQETHIQEPSKLNYDTTVIALAPDGQIVKVLVEGHTRDFGVESKWVTDHSLLMNVEWGHAVSCIYNVDLNKKAVSLSK